MAYNDVSGELIFRVFLLDEIVQSGLPLCSLARGHFVWGPCCRLARAAVVIEIVEIAKD